MRSNIKTHIQMKIMKKFITKYYYWHLYNTKKKLLVFNHNWIITLFMNLLIGIINRLLYYISLHICECDVFFIYSLFSWLLFALYVGRHYIIINIIQFWIVVRQWNRSIEYIYSMSEEKKCSIFFELICIIIAFRLLLPTMLKFI